MAEQTTTQVTTTTRTKVSDSAHVEELRVTLRNLSEELLEARERARAEVDDLDRIRGLLETESLAGLLTIIEELEETVETQERQLADGADKLEDLKAEYEDEQNRLTKLWDAYKVQEDELRRMQRDEPLLKERLADRDRMISELEDEAAKLRSYESYKERYQALARDHERLREHYRELEGDIEERNGTIAQMEAKMEHLQGHEDDSRRLKEMERQLHEEKERLAKLYKVYEDTEASLGEAEDEVQRWRDWYDRHRQAFELVGGAANYPVIDRGSDDDES